MTSTMTETKAVALLTKGLKGEKRKSVNLLDLASACRILRLNKDWGFGKMSRVFDVSEYQLRQIDKINELSVEIRRIIGKGGSRIGIESAYQLWRVGPKDQVELAKLIDRMNMTSDEVREFVHLLRTRKGATISETVEIFEKGRKKKVDILVLPLTSRDYQSLTGLAAKVRKGVHDYALEVLEEHIHAHKA